MTRGPSVDLRSNLDVKNHRYLGQLLAKYHNLSPQNVGDECELPDVDGTTSILFESNCKSPQISSSYRSETQASRCFNEV